MTPLEAFMATQTEVLRQILTQQHKRGEALMWWDHFKSMQRGRAVTWDDFKQAFKRHHIPKGLMDRKMRELLALRQGSDTVYRYAQKFNSLCQYGGHHVDTDAKKMERFHDGLDGKLYKRLNLLGPTNIHELVNKAIHEKGPRGQEEGVWFCSGQRN
jgi:hypothetical protein